MPQHNKRLHQHNILKPSVRLSLYNRAGPSNRPNAGGMMSNAPFKSSTNKVNTIKAILEPLVSRIRCMASFYWIKKIKYCAIALYGATAERYLTEKRHLKNWVKKNVYQNC